MSRSSNATRATVPVSAAAIARGQGPELVGALPQHWIRWTLGGIGLTAAYTMVMVAVRLAPVGYVTMLRESSVVIGALLGWLVRRRRRRQGAPPSNIPTHAHRGGPRPV